MLLRWKMFRLLRLDIVGGGPALNDMKLNDELGEKEGIRRPDDCGPHEGRLSLSDHSMIPYRPEWALCYQCKFAICCSGYHQSHRISVIIPQLRAS